MLFFSAALTKTEISFSLPCLVPSYLNTLFRIILFIYVFTFFLSFSPFIVQRFSTYTFFLSFFFFLFIFSFFLSFCLSSFFFLSFSFFLSFCLSFFLSFIHSSFLPSFQWVKALKARNANRIQPRPSQEVLIDLEEAAPYKPDSFPKSRQDLSDLIHAILVDDVVPTSAATQTVSEVSNAAVADNFSKPSKVCYTSIIIKYILRALQVHQGRINKHTFSGLPHGEP